MSPKHDREITELEAHRSRVKHCKLNYGFYIGDWGIINTSSIGGLTVMLGDNRYWPLYRPWRWWKNTVNKRKRARYVRRT